MHSARLKYISFAVPALARLYLARLGVYPNGPPATGKPHGDAIVPVVAGFVGFAGSAGCARHTLLQVFSNYAVAAKKTKYISAGSFLFPVLLWSSARRKSVPQLIVLLQDCGAISIITRSIDSKINKAKCNRKREWQITTTGMVGISFDLPPPRCPLREFRFHFSSHVPFCQDSQAIVVDRFWML